MVRFWRKAVVDMQKPDLENVWISAWFAPRPNVTAGNQPRAACAKRIQNVSRKDASAH